jgi:hypothetical protein
MHGIFSKNLGWQYNISPVFSVTLGSVWTIFVIMIAISDVKIQISYNIKLSHFFFFKTILNDLGQNNHRGNKNSYWSMNKTFSTNPCLLSSYVIDLSILRTRHKILVHGIFLQKEIYDIFNKLKKTFLCFLSTWIYLIQS